MHTVFKAAAGASSCACMWQSNKSRHTQHIADTDTAKLTPGTLRHEHLLMTGSKRTRLGSAIDHLLARLSAANPSTKRNFEAISNGSSKFEPHLQVLILLVHHRGMALQLHVRFFQIRNVVAQLPHGCLQPLHSPLGSGPTQSLVFFAQRLALVNQCAPSLALLTAETAVHDAALASAAGMVLQKVTPHSRDSEAYMAFVAHLWGYKG